MPTRGYQPPSQDTIGQLDAQQDAVFSLPKPPGTSEDSKSKKPTDDKTIPELEESPTQPTESETIRGGLDFASSQGESDRQSSEVAPQEPGLAVPESDTHEAGPSLEQDTGQQGIVTPERDTSEQGTHTPEVDTGQGETSTPEVQLDLPATGDEHPADVTPAVDSGEQDVLPQDAQPPTEGDASEHESAEGPHDVSSVVSSVGPSASQVGPPS